MYTVHCILNMYMLGCAVLLCLVVCLTLLATFFPSHLSNILHTMMLHASQTSDRVVDIRELQHCKICYGNEINNQLIFYGHLCVCVCVCV